ncbi:hypothetical protein J6590_016459 [Homalodisca vitripennis]|nr:hypothetical protein J6590_016459 [Homalodisca vitripennis]
MCYISAVRYVGVLSYCAFTRVQRATDEPLPPVSAGLMAARWEVRGWTPRDLHSPVITIAGYQRGS